MRAEDFLQAARKARRDRYGPCVAFGCVRAAKKGSEYCRRHVWRKKDASGFILDLQERTYMALKFCERLRKKLGNSQMSEEEVKSELLRVVMRLLSLESEGRQSFSGFLGDHGPLAHMNGSPVKRIKSELKRHLSLYRKGTMKRILDKMPYEFQVAEVEEREGFLRVLMMMRIDHQFDTMTGYMSVFGGFLPRECLIPIFEEAKTSGRMLFVSAQEQGFKHKIPRANHPDPKKQELRKKMLEDRAKRKMYFKQIEKKDDDS